MKTLPLIIALGFATTPAFARAHGIHTGRSVGFHDYRHVYHGYRHVYRGSGYGYGYNGYNAYNGYYGGDPGAAIGLGILGGILGGIP